jgi:hypothetical protein
MSEIVTEKEMYPVVEKWMKKHFQCFKTVIDKGLKYGRIDVLGVRDIGGDLSGEIETISIEVKKGVTPFAKACGQTLGYRVYANRVYLADLKQKGFSSDEIQIASNLGIGLIQIRGKTCKEILSSPYYQPITKLHLQLLESIAIGKCQLCQSFFETGENNDKRFSRLARENIKQAIEKEKGIVFWNYEAAYRKNKFNEKRKIKGGAYERRFICSDCISVIFSPLVDNKT